MTTGSTAEVEFGLLDTSVFIAGESGRPLGVLPRMAAVSVVTLAELYLGVLMADNPDIRAQRLRTLTEVEARFDALPIDGTVARAFAEIVADARRADRRPGIMDVWIAATALAHDLALYTQDEDFRGIPRVRIILV